MKGTKLWLTDGELAKQLRQIAHRHHLTPDESTVLFAAAGRLTGCRHPAYSDDGRCGEMACPNYTMKGTP